MRGWESLVTDGLDVILSGRKSPVKESDVSSDICVVPNLFPVVLLKKAAKPLTCGRSDEITGWRCTGFDPACE